MHTAAWFQDRRVGLAFVAGLCRVRAEYAAPHHVDRIHIEFAIDHDDAIGIRRRHAVIGNDDEVGRVEQPALLQSIDETRQGRVDFTQRIVHGR